MTRDRLFFLTLNIGHFLDHLFMLIFATAAALVLHLEWGVGYADLLIYATPGFFAFGLFALPAGWLADRWSRDGMMCVFFFGIGAASILTSFANTPLEIGAGLFIIGVFAAIYHPVGLAIVSINWKNMGMRLAMNGVWGNLGVACAALITGYLIDNGGWRLAFTLPGIFSIAVGIAYFMLRKDYIRVESTSNKVAATKDVEPSAERRALLVRVSAIVFLTAAISSLIFQSTTFALPKMFDERLQGLAADISNWGAGDLNGEGSSIATTIGALTFVTFTIASLAQLVVGKMLDLHGPRTVFMVVAAIQIFFFALMPGLENIWAFIVALGFMLGAFGQIPINDFLIGKMASGAYRARIYAVRYVVSFSVLAVSLPLIAFVHKNWGFDSLFVILAISAAIILCASYMLPNRI